jgi:hypothetical protein
MDTQQNSLMKLYNLEVLAPSDSARGRPGGSKLGDYGQQDRIITAFFIAMYVLLVCSILFCLVIAIIRCIRQRRRDHWNRAQLQASSQQNKHQ